MATVNAIETHRLEKEYRTSGNEMIHALRGLDLCVRRGEIYALLGPNGAGKTTTLNILTTLLLPTRGQAAVAGFDVTAQPAAVRRRIGVTFQEVVLDQELTGRQVLDFHSRLYGQTRAERSARIVELAALVELDDVLDRPAWGYSGGMKRRLELARGLMTRPEVLFLDEPTQGLDPHNRAGIWHYIRRLRAEQGLTLLLTTHDMEEATELADRVGIVDHGQLVVEGAPAELVRGLGADVVDVQGTGEGGDFAARVQLEPFVDQVSHTSLANEDLANEEAVSHRLQIGVDDGERRLVPILSLANATGFVVQAVTVHRPSLADVFLAHTGHALRDR
jgi:ABC-2 type transport system ATP-binding protein